MWKRIDIAVAAALVLLVGTFTVGRAGEMGAPGAKELAQKIREDCRAILKKAYASEEAFIRSGAIRAAGEALDPDLIPLLEQGTRDFYPTTRLFALQALQKVREEAALVAARRLMSDSNIWVRSAALEIAADLGDRASVPEIRKQLETPDRMVRLAAAYALFKLGEKDYYSEIVDASGGGDAVQRYQAISYLGKIADEASLQHLVDLLDSKEEDIVAYALKALGEHADITMLNKLMRLSLSSNPSVRGKAVLAMGYLPPVAVLKELKPFCNDSDPEVRLSAALSLHRLGKQDCRGVFADLLEHPDFGVRSMTARILGETSLPNRPELLRTALADPVTRVRTAAVRAAGMMGGSEAFQLLLPMLEDPQEVIRAYAAGNLIRVLG